MTDKVLIVEDDADIAELIRVNLSELGIGSVHTSCGNHGLKLALETPYALLLLDVMLPGISGLDICRQVRQHSPHQAILMLTAKNSETDRVLGLELGADDYMTKPFSIRELQARVRAQLRKASLLAQLPEHSDKSRDVVQLGYVSIDNHAHQVRCYDRVLELTATEFELLQFFMRHPNQVFSRCQLLESVWGYHHSGYEHTVNSHINRLRAKLEMDPNKPAIIQTVWGVGYKLNAQGCGAQA